VKGKPTLIKGGKEEARYSRQRRKKVLILASEKLRVSSKEKRGGEGKGNLMTEEEKTFLILEGHRRATPFCRG